MKIIVCINHVPDTETKIKVGADGTTIDPSGVNWRKASACANASRERS